MPMNFEKFEYESPIEEPITYDYILKYFDQYVKLFEKLKPSDDLETIIKHAYAPQELRGILEELEKIKIKKLNSENEYISIKTSCRWLRQENSKISLDHFANLGTQIVTRVAMVLGEVIKNLKKFLSLDETTTLDNKIIREKLQTINSFEDTNYKILSGHINGEVVKYFSEENIKLPIDSENRIESLLNNKIIMNCVELCEKAKETATSYEKAVTSGDMKKFIDDIIGFFKKRTDNKPDNNIKIQSIDQNLGNTKSEMLVKSEIPKSKSRFSFSRKTENKKRKESENLKINDKSLVLKNKNSLANNAKSKISSPDSIKQEQVMTILEKILSTSKLDNKITKIIIKGATWLAKRGAKLKNPALQRKLDQLKLTQELQKKKITNISSHSSEEANDDDINKKTKKSKLDKLKKIFKICKTEKNQNSENNGALTRKLKKLIK